MSEVRIIVGDVLARLGDLPDASVHCVVTSPPYWGLRDYGVEGQLGLEGTIEEFVEKMTAVFEEVRRVLRDDGTLWLNMGDCYTDSGRGTDVGSGLQGSRRNQAECRKVKVRELHKQQGMRAKNLVGQPWRLAFALQAAGWYLRSDIIWAKPNPMPESCRDRPTKSHEYVFLMTKKPHYFFDQEAVRERWADDRCGASGDAKMAYQKALGRRTESSTLAAGPQVSGRNIRSVWKIATQPFPEAHFATFPEELPRRCIAAGTSEKGCCPECGAPWVRVVEKSGGTPDPARGWDTAPGGHGREKRRELGAKGSSTPADVRSSAGARMGRGAGWRKDGQCHEEYRGKNSTEPKTSGARRILKNVAAARAAGGDHDNPFPAPRTTGWKPGCGCTAGSTPCTVLDPFGGSGTTALVASKMGRSAILIELSPKYAAMAERRIRNECGLLANVRLEAATRPAPE